MARFEPIRRWFAWVASFLIPGLGMFNEAYYIFSVGNLMPIWAEQYPACWKDHVGCSEGLLHALNYSQVAGLFLGMITFGFAIDIVGRKAGSVAAALIMFLGGILLTAASGPSPRALFTFLIAAQSVFGFGVGGEFPVASSSASETSELSPGGPGGPQRSKRGETVVLVFSMQAWGNICNLSILLLLLAALGQGSPPYSAGALGLVWRLQYGLGLLPIAFMIVQRSFYLQESHVWKEKKRERASRSLEPQRLEWRKAALLASHYWHRLLGASLGWFAWDFYYYGNKLFQSEFISLLHPGSDLITQLQFNMLNSSVALFGYYFAAFTVDRSWMGRRRMQIMGFAVIFALFLASGVELPTLESSQSGLRALQAMYYLTSFFGQFGPNATTFLLASEMFPTEVRGAASGLAAAAGKLGALAADIAMGKVGDQMRFYLSAGAGAVGALVTLLFIPDLTLLNLAEGDCRWASLRQGGAAPYTGEAINPRNLSFYERLVGIGAPYTPDLKHVPAPGTAESSDGSVNMATGIAVRNSLEVSSAGQSLDLRHVKSESLSRTTAGKQSH
eukprot:jgi/Botrbrau1/15007/Bobra.0018s0106.1